MKSTHFRDWVLSTLKPLSSESSSGRDSELFPSSPHRDRKWGEAGLVMAVWIPVVTQSAAKVEPYPTRCVSPSNATRRHKLPHPENMVKVPKNWFSFAAAIECLSDYSMCHKYRYGRSNAYSRGRNRERLWCTYPAWTIANARVEMTARLNA